MASWNVANFYAFHMAYLYIAIISRIVTLSIFSCGSVMNMMVSADDEPEDQYEENHESDNAEILMANSKSMAMMNLKKTPRVTVLVLTMKLMVDTLQSMRAMSPVSQTNLVCIDPVTTVSIVEQIILMADTTVNIMLLTLMSKWHWK